MADHSHEGSSTSSNSGEPGTSIIELNIKTLDSHIYSFHVNKDVRSELFSRKKITLFFFCLKCYLNYLGFGRQSRDRILKRDSKKIEIYFMF